MAVKFVLILLFANNVQATSEIAFDSMAECKRTAQAVMKKLPDLPYDDVPYACVSARQPSDVQKLFLHPL